MMKQPVGSSSSSWVVLPCRKGLMARRLSMMPLRLCCLGMTAAFRGDVGEDDDEETLGAWSGWRKDGGALMDALKAGEGK